MRLDAVEGRVDRAVAVAFLDRRLAVDVELHGGALRPAGAGDHRQRDELDAVLRGRDLLVDQRLDVLVVDVLLAVGERLEAHEGVFELVAGELDSPAPSSLCTKAWRPECLPMTSEVCFTPTLSGVMIS